LSASSDDVRTMTKLTDAITLLVLRACYKIVKETLFACSDSEPNTYCPQVLLTKSQT